MSFQANTASGSPRRSRSSVADRAVSTSCPPACSTSTTIPASRSVDAMSSPRSLLRPGRSASRTTAVRVPARARWARRVAHGRPRVEADGGAPPEPRRASVRGRVDGDDRHAGQRVDPQVRRAEVPDDGVDLAREVDEQPLVVRRVGPCRRARRSSPAPPRTGRWPRRTPGSTGWPGRTPRGRGCRASPGQAATEARGPVVQLLGGREHPRLRRGADALHVVHGPCHRLARHARRRGDVLDRRSAARVRRTLSSTRSPWSAVTRTLAPWSGHPARIIARLDSVLGRWHRPTTP